jgi:tetratricopeptide (TPR) repeat protein
MRHACLVAGLLFTLRCTAYELTGRIEPPLAVPVFLHGATAPFESATQSDVDGRFRFHKISAGTYTLAITTPARGQALETVELSPGTVDSKGRLDMVLRIDDSRLESEGARTSGATVSATFLSIPDRAMREYEEAQSCLTRRESDCASGRLLRAVEMAPQFVAAWNQLGVMAYQSQRYEEAEAKFRRALDADPEAFEPLVNLGGVLLNLGRAQEALRYNERAVSRRPNNALANSQLGLTYFDLDDPNLAEKYLKTAIQLDPAHFSHPQLALAEIYRRRGDRASALGQLRGFLKQHPDSPQAAAVRREIEELQRIP